jgi:hypothetical protein
VCEQGEKKIMSNVPPIPQAPPAPPQTTKPTDPKEGRYKAKAATPDPTGTPHEFGRSKNGNPELLVHVFLPELQRTYVTVLYFSKEAAPYSEERLRALGCVDLTTLAGIDANEVDVELRYEWYDGSWRTRVQILSGGGVFHTSSPMQGGGKEFAAIVAATLGRPANLAGGDAVAGSNGAPKPPF